MTLISERVRRIGVSPTLRISAQARRMRADGIDVIDLSIGEPDFDTPAIAKQAGIDAIEANRTHYTPTPGTPELRRAIVGWIDRHLGVRYDESAIIVSNGAKHSIANLMLALLDPDDEVIIPAPWWVSYPELARLAGGRSVFVETREEDRFLMRPEALRKKLTPRTKLLVLNNPSNPTGATYSREELVAILDVALDHDGLMIAADEIYSQLVYDDFPFASVASISDEAKERTIMISGASKSFAMTGWRIGFAAGPAEVIAAMKKVQGHLTSNACSIAQAAAEAAFANDPPELGVMREAFAERRDAVMNRVLEWPGVRCHRPEGAFYVFPNLGSYFDAHWNGVPIGGSERLAQYLLEEAHVAIVPGSAFGMEGYLRISYAASLETLMDALTRIDDALGRLDVT